MGKGRRGQVNIPLCAAAVLLCLTLLSTHLVGGLYARYTTTASGSDGARVAKFSITETKNGALFTEDFTVSTVPGETAYTVSVENNSEVAVAYTVSVTNTTGNVPYIFSVNGSEYAVGSCSAAAYLAVGEEAAVSVKVKWNEEGATAYIGMVDRITVTLQAAQVD